MTSLLSLFLAPFNFVMIVFLDLSCSIKEPEAAMLLQQIQMSANAMKIKLLIN